MLAIIFITVIVQSLNRVQLFSMPWTAAGQAPLSSTISQSLLKLMSLESVMLSNHLILCHPLLLLPSIFSSIRVFPSEWALRIRWPKYWSCSFSPSNEYSGLMSFRMHWFDLLAVWGILRSLLQHRRLKALIQRAGTMFMVTQHTSERDQKTARVPAFQVSGFLPSHVSSNRLGASNRRLKCSERYPVL